MAYDEQAAAYDLLYRTAKDYAAEARAVSAIVRGRCPDAATLLDVGCGTGLHLERLRTQFDVVGLDVSEAMLAIARHRLPDVELVLDDMRAFDLGRSFDAVICMFAAIAHVGDVAELHQSVRRMVRHVSPGGVVVVEPYVTLDQWIDGFVGYDAGAADGVTIVRATRSRREQRRAVMEMYYTVLSQAEVSQFSDTLTATLFTDDEYSSAMLAAGLTDVELLTEDFPDRGLWVGTARREAPVG